ncbi:MAG: HAMP domain-containing sensor histidine kinase [Clostridiaceae bacterium]
MEERKLRTHLIRIYVVTVAGILGVLLATVLLLSVRENEQKSRESFSTLLTAIADDLQVNSVVRHSELRQLEQENRLQIRISDNGKSLLYNSKDSAEKADLLNQVEQLAREQGYDTLSLPLTKTRRTSPVTTLSDGKDRYLGAVCILPLANGYRTLSLVQRMDSAASGSVLLYCALYLGGVLLLYGVGVLLIDRALLPALESRKRQKQFVAAASHELRSPLAVISANAALLPQSGSDGSAAGVIQRECGRMSRLIGDLLLLASADAEAWAVALEPLEPDTLLLNVYESYLPLYGKNGCTLVLTLPDAPVLKIAGDGERLSQVLGVLLDNALSYGVSAEQKTVELNVRCQKQWVVICIADHGCGLSAEQKARIFDRFYRADTARKEKQHFGLGLSIAKELVTLHKGTLDVLDTPGGGCTFRVQLPAAK